MCNALKGVITLLLLVVFVSFSSGALFLGSNYVVNQTAKNDWYWLFIGGIVCVLTRGVQGVHGLKRFPIFSNEWLSKLSLKVEEATYLKKLDSLKWEFRFTALSLFMLLLTSTDFEQFFSGDMGDLKRSSLVMTFGFMMVHFIRSVIESLPKSKRSGKFGKCLLTIAYGFSIFGYYSIYPIASGSAFIPQEKGLPDMLLLAYIATVVFTIFARKRLVIFSDLIFATVSLLATLWLTTKTGYEHGAIVLGFVLITAAYTSVFVVRRLEINGPPI